jgi:hypothetical protein
MVRVEVLLLIAGFRKNIDLDTIHCVRRRFLPRFRMPYLLDASPLYSFGASCQRWCLTVAISWTPLLYQRKCVSSMYLWKISSSKDSHSSSLSPVLISLAFPARLCLPQPSSATTRTTLPTIEPEPPAAVSLSGQALTLFILSSPFYSLSFPDSLARHSAALHQSTANGATSRLCHLRHEPRPDKTSCNVDVPVLFAIRTH